LIQAFSRPGVFSHRRLDVGARVLMETMRIEPGIFVLDIGCGCGAVGLAAAKRAEGVRVHAIDSNARAIASTLRGAMLNDFSGITAFQTADGSLVAGEQDLSGQFDVAVGNPPYFSHYQIAEIFLQAARKGLRPGGRVWMVTKHTEWMVARMEQLFTEVEPKEVRGYTVVSGRQKSSFTV
jgi:16S rRNA (guanine1207-N2)-methyltransferase